MECTEERSRSRSGVASREILENMEASCAARLAGDSTLYRTLLQEARALLRRNKKRYVRDSAEDAESYLYENDLRPVFQTL